MSFFFLCLDGGKRKITISSSSLNTSFAKESAPKIRTSSSKAVPQVVTSTTTVLPAVISSVASSSTTFSTISDVVQPVSCTQHNTARPSVALTSSRAAMDARPVVLTPTTTMNRETESLERIAMPTCNAVITRPVAVTSQTKSIQSIGIPKSSVVTIQPANFTCSTPITPISEAMKTTAQGNGQMVSIGSIPISSTERKSVFSSASAIKSVTSVMEGISSDTAKTESKLNNKICQ